MSVTYVSDGDAATPSNFNEWLNAASGDAFNVKSYGAAGDGSTDDTAAIQAAVTAADGAGVVFFPPGTYYLGSGNHIALPMGATRLVIRGSGIGNTIIKLSSSCPSFLYPNKTADDQTFQNVTVEDLSIDGDSVGGKRHVILGTKQSNAVTLYNINIANIVLRRIRSYNVPTDPNTGTNHRRQVHLVVQHSAANRATQNTITNVVCEDVEMIGGNSGIEVMGGSDGNGCNVFVDDVHFVRCHHDMTGDRSAFFASSHFHIGSEGFGGLARIRDCTGRGSADVGIETNAITDMIVEGCDIWDAYGNAYYYTHFHYPGDEAGTEPDSNTNTLEEQRIVYRSCRAHRVESANTSGSGYRTAHNFSIPLGTILFEDCIYERQGLDLDTVGEAFYCNAPCKEYQIVRPRIDISGVDLPTGGSTSTPSAIRIRYGGLNEPMIARVIAPRIRLSGTRHASAAARTFVGIYCVGGAGALLDARLTIEDPTFAFSLTNWTGQALRMIQVGGGQTDEVYNCVIRGFSCLADSGGGSSWSCIAFNGTDELTIHERAVVADCDFAGLTTGVGVHFLVSNENKDKIQYRNNADFITASNGTATLSNGNTTVAVTHGLNVTPALDDISVTPIEAWGSSTQFWITSPTSTQFTINVDQNPGQDVDFAWTASIQ